LQINDKVKTLGGKPDFYAQYFSKHKAGVQKAGCGWRHDAASKVKRGTINCGCVPRPGGQQARTAQAVLATPGYAARKGKRLVNELRSLAQRRKGE
jgi:hypothetical protein